MTDFIDVSDLDDEDKKLIQMIVERLKRTPVNKLNSDSEGGLSKRANSITPKESAGKKEDFTLSSWDSDVIEKLTREELYEDR